MSAGLFAVHRDVFKHGVFADEAYTEREAWLWLIGHAAWRPTRTRVKDGVIPLERGQCAFSLRFLAQRWQWSKSRVSRYLEMLKNEDMIGTQAGRDATLITILNYNDYQFEPGRRRDADDAESGTQAGRRRDKEEEDNKLIREDAAFGAPEIPAIPPNTVIKTGEPHPIERPVRTATPETELYDRGKAILGKNAGGMIAKLVKSKDGNIPLARAAIEIAATKQNPREYIGAIVNKRDGPPDDTVIINGRVRHRW